MASQPTRNVPDVTGIHRRRPPMLLHVLLVVHAVDHRAGAEEEQRLEEGVGDHVEQAGDVGAGPDGEEHVAELGDGGVGEHPLDVVLGAGDRRRERAPSPPRRMATTMGRVGGVARSGLMRASR